MNKKIKKYISVILASGIFNSLYGIDAYAYKQIASETRDYNNELITKIKNMDEKDEIVKDNKLDAEKIKYVSELVADKLEKKLNKDGQTEESSKCSKAERSRRIERAIELMNGITTNDAAVFLEGKYNEDEFEDGKDELKKYLDILYRKEKSGYNEKPVEALITHVQLGDETIEGVCYDENVQVMIRIDPDNIKSDWVEYNDFKSSEYGEIKIEKDELKHISNLSVVKDGTYEAEELFKNGIKIAMVKDGKWKVKSGVQFKDGAVIKMLTMKDNYIGNVNSATVVLYDKKMLPEMGKIDFPDVAKIDSVSAGENKIKGTGPAGKTILVHVNGSNEDRTEKVEVLKKVKVKANGVWEYSLDNGEDFKQGEEIDIITLSNWVKDDTLEGINIGNYKDEIGTGFMDVVRYVLTEDDFEEDDKNQNENNNEDNQEDNQEDKDDKKPNQNDDKQNQGGNEDKNNSQQNESQKTDNNNVYRSSSSSSRKKHKKKKSEEVFVDDIEQKDDMNSSDDVQIADKKENSGWICDDSKTWSYIKEDKTKAKNCWLSINNKWYNFDNNGIMVTGWIKDKEKWYYLKSTGEMATGWIKDNGNWYYLNSTGAMVTGWVNDNNNWYYLNDNGTMRTGWININNLWYYLDESGKMAVNTTINGYKINKKGIWVQ